LKWSIGTSDSVIYVILAVAVVDIFLAVVGIRTKPSRQAEIGKAKIKY
jgi:hypothetical protein